MNPVYECYFYFPLKFIGKYIRAEKIIKRAMVMKYSLKINTYGIFIVVIRWTQLQ